MWLPYKFCEGIYIMHGNAAKGRETPLLKAESAKKAFARLPAMEGACGRKEGIVLLADDNSDLRETYGVMLEGKARFKTAKDGFEALGIFERYNVSLVITDIHMVGGNGEVPGNGIWLVRRIREIDPDVHIVIVSGGAIDDEREAALAAGASEFLNKPLGMDRLAEIINKNSDQMIDLGH